MSRILKSIVVSTAVSLPLLILAPPSTAQAQWKTPPSLDENSIPVKAREEGVSGNAIVSCTATALGIVDNCQIESESPEGYGFGQAAIDILQTGILHPTEDGQPIARFRTRIPFKVEELPAAPVFDNPQWETPPQPRASDFPQRALNAGVSGGAAIRCTAAENGAPENCYVLQERPTDYGFGEAAVKIVKRGRLRQGGWATGAGFTVIVPFNLN